MNKNRNNYKKNSYNKNREEKLSKFKQSEPNNYQDLFSDKQKMKRQGMKNANTVATYTGSKIDNDPSWYSPNEEITKSTASISFSAATGKPFVLHPRFINPEIPQEVSNTAYLATPGVCVLNIAHTAGNAATSIDAVNVSAQSVFTFMRSKINGSRIYEAPDVMKYLIATDSPYSFRSWMVRLYGLFQWVSISNRYTPKALINALGVDYEDVSANLAQFRSYINQYTLRLSQLAVPQEVTYNTRHIWMYENIYMDSDTVKAQYYVYNPSQMYVYQEGTNATVRSSLLCYDQQNTGNFSSWHRVSTGDYRKFSDIVNFGNSLLTPILASEDFKTISGDIFNAFGDNAVIKMNMISEDFSIKPVFSREVLSQIENADILPSENVYSSITEEASINQGFLVENTGIDAEEVPGNIAYYLQTNEKLINFHWNNPTPADVVVATRLKHGYVDPQNTVSVTRHDGTTINCNPVKGYSSEVVTSAYILTLRTDGVYRWDILQGTNILNTGKPGDLTEPTVVKTFMNAVEQAMFKIGYISTFDWAPITRFAFYNGNSQVYIPQPICDLDVCTTLDYQTLLNINEAAMLKMFNVPNMGSFSYR